jgi:hypothetical protein
MECGEPFAALHQFIACGDTHCEQWSLSGSM